ncbi:MAG: hypothetical protein FI731_05695 [SAR202 cluster bacterium]|nr:hypothetical protein [SAR202 cluster bacterium]
MPNYVIMAAMRGRFLSERGNTYDNFQMLGYSNGPDPTSAVSAFFDQPQYPIDWGDVEYLWAERLADDPSTGHLGDYERVYVETLRKRWEDGGQI